MLWPRLSVVFRRLICLSSFPPCWRHANVAPIPKGPPSSSAANYRPISMTSVLSKPLMCLSAWCLFVLDDLWKAMVCIQSPSLLIWKVWVPVTHFCVCPIHCIVHWKVGRRLVSFWLISVQQLIGLTMNAFSIGSARGYWKFCVVYTDTVSVKPITARSQRQLFITVLHMRGQGALSSWTCILRPEAAFYYSLALERPRSSQQLDLHFETGGTLLHTLTYLFCFHIENYIWYNRPRNISGCINYYLISELPSNVLRNSKHEIDFRVKIISIAWNSLLFTPRYHGCMDGINWNGTDTWVNITKPFASLMFSSYALHPSRQ